MNEFDPQPVETTPATTPPPPAHRQGFLTRPILLGYSLPWLVGIFLVLGGLAWFLFWPASSSQDASQRAFGQNAGLETVQRPSASPDAHSTAPVPLQTGGLNVPSTVGAEEVAGSAPDDIVALMREGREFEAANREAITRLSDTVRAQTKALAALQQQVDVIAKDNAGLASQLKALSVKPVADMTSHATSGRKGSRSAIAGMRLESLQGGMAWVSWQGRTWAVQPGDSLGGVIVRDVNAVERCVTTSAGVLR